MMMLRLLSCLALVSLVGCSNFAVCTCTGNGIEEDIGRTDCDCEDAFEKVEDACTEAGGTITSCQYLSSDGCILTPTGDCPFLFREGQAGIQVPTPDSQFAQAD